MVFNYGKLQIEWLGHDSFRISTQGKIIYTDPYILDDNPFPADIILITHEHHDHCAVDNIKKILKDTTIVVAPQNCLTKLAFVPRNNLRLIGTDNALVLGSVKLRTIPAYNIDKFRSPRVPFHPRNFGVGYIFNFAGVVIYHAGDTDFVPEMKELVDDHIDVALIPVSGVYVMTVREAAEAVKEIKPKVAIPMHYGAGVAGTVEDAEKFKSLIEDVEDNQTEVQIL